MTDRLRRTQPLLLTAAAGITAGALLVASATSIAGSLARGATTADMITTVAEPLDPEVILPSRVDAAVHRVLWAMERATAAVDDKHRNPALKALAATRLSLARSWVAGFRQVTAAPPPGDEEESTAGPDSVLAILNVDQVTITQLAGLFDRVTGPKLSAALKRTLNAGLHRRASLLATVLALDPEEAGAPYADVLVDTVPNYTDEVANLAETLSDDHLTAPNRATLRTALTKSQAAEAQVLAAFGGAD